VIELREEEGKSWIELTITEGKNRQIHRMVEAIGLRVMRLSRISFAGVTSEGLRPGQIRALDPAEIAALRRIYLGAVEARRPAREPEVHARPAVPARDHARGPRKAPRKGAPARAEAAQAPPARKAPATFDRSRTTRHKKGPTRRG